MVKYLGRALVIVFFLVSSQGFAAEKPSKAARKLTKMMTSKKDFEETFIVNFNAGMKRSMGSANIKPEQMEKIQVEARKLAKEIYNDPDFLNNIALCYDESFTKEELKGLTAFYKTPVGKKFLTKLPKLIQSTAMVGQRITQKHLPQFQAKVQMIMAGTYTAEEKKPVKEKSKTKPSK